MKGKRYCALLLAALLLSGFSCVQADTLTVFPEQILHEVSPTLYGIFIEDINCAVDGGLYAELVKNRSFENENLWNPRHTDHWDAWSVRKQEKASASLESILPLSAQNPTYLQAVLEESGMLQIRNQGFGGNLLRGGIAVEAGKQYDLSLCLRFDDTAAQTGMVSAVLTDAAGNPVSEKASFRGDVHPAGVWRSFKATLQVSETTGAFLTLEFAGKGIMDADMVSLMPADRFGKDWPGGGMRADLVEALRKLHPRFMRFPGGCIVEGTYVRSNAYAWKDTLGDTAMRREIPNTWGDMQTMGVGFFEYFCLAEEIGALPVPVVHAGLLCQARDAKDSPLTLEETKAYIQDILDLIEFATGSVDTPWGQVRAGMGHPEPFDLRYIAIGNENWGASYFSRYAILSGAVHEAYPDITCIVGAGPVAEGGLFQDSWNNIRRRFSEDLVDEHFYMDSSWFPAHASRYDSYPRTTKVFLGEYAAHEPVQGNRRPNNLYAALCEAAFLTGIERNSDVVVMSCYAPLLCREKEADWTPDLIWFNENSIYCTPSYYVQQMLSNACGTELVASETDGGLFQAVTRTEQELQIKVINLSGNAKSLTLLLTGVGNQTVCGQVLTGEKEHVNSFARMDKVSPQEIMVTCADGKAEIELPPWSLTILKAVLTK